MESMLEAARWMELSAFDVVEYCKAGHCVMISNPGWMVEKLRRAEEGVEWI
jgi:hypothetical protein